MVAVLARTIAVVRGASVAHSKTPRGPEVWYSPHFGPPGRTDFPLLVAPHTAWPSLAARTATFKLKMFPLIGANSCDDELAALVAAIDGNGMATGLEIGGARWGGGRCNATSQLQYAMGEQKAVSRWLRLGGSITSVTTDHALTWDIRNELRVPPCNPPVPLEARIEAVAQVFGSWRKFLGPNVSLGFIESLGYWDIQGPDGTNFTNVAPAQLNNISGWIRTLGGVTDALLSVAKRHNPTPNVRLLSHYQIDYGLDGVEQDTLKYGRSAGGGINYGRILGAEAIMAARGLQTGVILNANAAHQRTYAPIPAGCLVGCDPGFTPSHSAAVRTLNVTLGYMAQDGRRSQHILFEQWQAYPNVTGPETAKDTGMWMAAAAARIVHPDGLKSMAHGAALAGN